MKGLLYLLHSSNATVFLFHASFSQVKHDIQVNTHIEHRTKLKRLWYRRQPKIDENNKKKNNNNKQSKNEPTQKEHFFGLISLIFSFCWLTEKNERKRQNENLKKDKLISVILLCCFCSFRVCALTMCVVCLTKWQLHFACTSFVCLSSFLRVFSSFSCALLVSHYIAANTYTRTPWYSQLLPTNMKYHHSPF